MERKDANLKLLKILQEEIEANPDLRFSQMLCNLGFVKSEKIYVVSESTGIRYETGQYWKDEHYLESTALLERVKE